MAQPLRAARLGPGRRNSQTGKALKRRDDEIFDDECQVPASVDAEMMGYHTYDDYYAGS